MLKTNLPASVTKGLHKGVTPGYWIEKNSAGFYLVWKQEQDYLTLRCRVLADSEIDAEMYYVDRKPAYAETSMGFYS